MSVDTLLSGGEFPFGAWEGPRRFVVTDKESANARFAEMRECGINRLFLFAELADTEWLKLTVGAAEANGIGLIVDLGAVWRDRERLDKVIDQTAGCGSVVAFNVVDEPPIGWFDELAPVVGYVKSRANGKCVFTNLNPSYAPAAYLGESKNGKSAYYCYLDEFAGRAKPDCLSFDFYPYVGDDGANGRMRAKMLSDLCDIRAVADKNKIPFCGFLQASRWGKVESGEWHGTKMPTEDEYRFLVNIQLTFGAVMLTDFLYWSRTGTRPEQRMPGVFDGIMAENGERTEMFEITRRVKNEVMEIAKRIAGSRCRGVVQIGLDGERAELFKEVEPSGFGNVDISTDGELVCGCFEDTDGKFVYAVNVSDRVGAELVAGDKKYALRAGEGVVISI